MTLIPKGRYSNISQMQAFPELFFFFLKFEASALSGANGIRGMTKSDAGCHIS